ncbi:hypothetical protein [Streptomyces sp. NPDC048350]|uniref:hypothetical protein n=1 Tax=Streptomyces sp. NPDC048350 TaxID=3365538 RepID=UPI00371853FE
MRATSRGKVAIAAAASWVLLTGTAFAATDTLMPTRNYTYYCGSGHGICQTDNETLTYYMDSGGTYELESNDRYYVNETVSSDYAPTDLVISYDSSPSFSGDAETDHIWQEGSTGLSDDAAGMTWCNDAVDLYACDQHYIRIRGNGYYVGSLTCHEMGHGVGLVHGDLAYPTRSRTDVAAMGCMVTGTAYSPDLGTNNFNNINATY